MLILQTKHLVLLLTIVVLMDRMDHLAAVVVEAVEASPEELADVIWVVIPQPFLGKPEETSQPMLMRMVKTHSISKKDLAAEVVMTALAKTEKTAE